MHDEAVKFDDRRDAGRRLAAVVPAEQLPAIVLGLPRGGVPVAAEVARRLHAPLDVLLVRKLGVPFQSELAMGAIGEDGVRVANRDVMAMTGTTDDDLDRVEVDERVELERRSRAYRAVRPRESLQGRVALIVDDGIATGATARAACEVARRHGAARVVLAVPVAPAGWRDDMGDAADAYVAVMEPAHFSAVGEWYREFGQTSDDEVVELLRAASMPTTE